MIVFIILAAMIIAVVLYNPPLEKYIGGSSFPDVDEIQKRIHEYSGIHKDEYMRYIVSIDNARAFITDPDMAAQSLYDGIEHLRNVGLHLPGGDSSVPDEIQALSGELGTAMERYILNEALRQGVRFEPAYLNEKFLPIEY